MAHPTAVASGVSSGVFLLGRYLSGEAQVSKLYHYTNERGLTGIVKSGELRPSLKVTNPADVRYGNGQYLSDMYASGQAQVGIRANKLAGDSIRDVIAAREAPALTEQTFTTIGGVRRVDVLKIGNDLVSIESKVGRTSLSAEVRQELARDWWLRRQNQVAGGVVWLRSKR